ncbi:MAG: leucine-rich repeat domain-containing protein [Clostridia bacterium]|nr:leucine-rich repeat domain-containing protein [Clostridia bacterium]
MKKAKLLLSLVMILAVVSMVLFACGDKDAHDCKDANFDHKCDVCETSILCFDNDNNHNCDICGKELSYCFDNTSDHKCELCGETITSCKDENRDHSCDICGKVSSCEDKTNDHKCDVCEKELSVCADENSDHKCDVCKKELSVCKDEDNDGFCDICNEYICLSFIKNQDNTYSVSSFDGSRRDVIIPSTYKGLPVTSIGNRAFYECTSLVSIEIPSSITSIGHYAFVGCTSLTSIEIPSSVTSIGDDAFASCWSLTSIEIPSSVTSIGNFAFYCCMSLTSIVIPSSVTSIGSSAFENCTSLTIYCEAESEPSGWSAYWSNRPVVWGYDASNLKIIDGVHYYIKDGSAVATGHEANVTNVTILSTIENNEVTYSVTSIGYGAFLGCTSLTSVVIEDGVTSIGHYAFEGCTSLTSIEIPSSVTSIGHYAFYNCKSLTVYCEAESKPSSWSADWNYTDRPVVWGYDANNLKIIDGVHYYIKYGSAVVMGHEANVTNVTILSTIENNGVTYSVTSIVDYVFEGCTSLTSIVIPSSVTSIGDYAFSHCTLLTSIVIPSSVTSIGYAAFSGCTLLTSIVIPSSVTSIGYYAFVGCTSLTIYCEAESKPSGWHSNWNSSNIPVVWGYSENA